MMERRADGGQIETLAAAVTFVRPTLYQTIVFEAMYETGDVTFVTKHVPAQEAWRETRYGGDVGKSIVAWNRESVMLQKKTVSEIQKQE